MAVCIKNVSRSKDQELIKTWIPQRFLTSRTKLSLSANQPAVIHLKSTKPSYTQWNSYLELRKGSQYSSTASFHHLAINFLICDVTYVTNTATRNFAKGNEDLPTLGLDSHLGSINETFAKENLEKELSRLRRKGAMKDILNKIPEGVQGIKGDGPQGDKKF